MNESFEISSHRPLIPQQQTWIQPWLVLLMDLLLAVLPLLPLLMAMDLDLDLTLENKNLDPGYDIYCGALCP